MDKAKIVEQVAREVTNAVVKEQTGLPNGWNRIGNDSRDKVKRDVGMALAAAGYFALLTERDALRKVVEAAQGCIDVVLLNMKHDDTLSDTTKALIKALADLDALGGGE